VEISLFLDALVLLYFEKMSTTGAGLSDQRTFLHTFRYQTITNLTSLEINTFFNQSENYTNLLTLSTRYEQLCILTDWLTWLGHRCMKNEVDPTSGVSYLTWCNQTDGTCASGLIVAPNQNILK
jgi:hypothetical protein